MGIKVGHSVGAGPIAAAAFGGAQGQARASLSAGRAAAAEREFIRKQQLAEEERQRQLALQGQTTQQALMRTNYDLQQQSAEAAQDRELEGFEKRFTTQQRLQAEQWASAEAKALADPSFSERDKEEIKYRFAQLRAGMTPVARPKQITPAERFAQNSFTDKAGRIIALDENGIPGKVLREPPEREPTWQDKLKAREIAMKMAANGETGAVDRVKAAAIYAELMNEAAGVAAPGVAPQVGGDPGFAAAAGSVPAAPGFSGAVPATAAPAARPPMGLAASAVAPASIGPGAGSPTPAPAASSLTPDAVGEAERRLVEARSKANGVETKEVKAAKAELAKARQAAHDERANAVPDLDTPEGIALRLEQIGTAGRGGKIGLAGINREAELDPEEVQNLATAEYQIAVARKDLEEIKAKAEADSKELMASAETGPARQRARYLVEHRTKGPKERLAELEKRKTALESERTLLRARQVAQMVKGGAPVAAPAPPPEQPSVSTVRLANGRTVTGKVSFGDGTVTIESEIAADKNRPGAKQGTSKITIPSADVRSVDGKLPPPFVAAAADRRPSGDIRMSAQEFTPDEDVEREQRDVERGQVEIVKQRLSDIDVKISEEQRFKRAGYRERIAALKRQRAADAARLSDLRDKVK